MAGLAAWAEAGRKDGETIPRPRTLAEILASDEVEAGEAIVMIPLLLDAGLPVEIDVSFDAGLLDAIDAAATRRGLTRSAFLASAAREKIEAQRRSDGRWRHETGGHLGALDLAFDLSGRAKDHALMKRRYFELLADVEEGAKTLVQAKACLHRFSAEEEPAFHALLNASWNAAQEMVYGDEAHAYELSRWVLLRKNICRFEGRVFRLRTGGRA